MVSRIYAIAISKAAMPAAEIADSFLYESIFSTLIRIFAPPKDEAKTFVLSTADKRVCVFLSLLRVALSQNRLVAGEFEIGKE